MPDYGELEYGSSEGDTAVTPSYQDADLDAAPAKSSAMTRKVASLAVVATLAAGGALYSQSIGGISDNLENMIEIDDDDPYLKEQDSCKFNCGHSTLDW